MFRKRFVIYKIINIVLFSVLTRYKVSFIENVRFTDCASWIRLPDCSKLVINRKKNNGVTFCQHDVIFNFFSRFFVSLVNFSYWSKFHVNMIPGSGAMTILFYKGWQEIWKLKAPLSEFCPVSGNWGKLEITNLVRMFLMKCYWMLQNSRVIAGTISELLRLKQEGGGWRGEGVKLFRRNVIPNLRAPHFSFKLVNVELFII